MVSAALLCNSSQFPAGGGNVRHQAKGKAAAELPEILPRFQAAAGDGAAHAPVAAPAGWRLPGTSRGEASHDPARFWHTSSGSSHWTLLFLINSTCCQKLAPGTLTFFSSIAWQTVRQLKSLTVTHTLNSMKSNAFYRKINSNCWVTSCRKQPGDSDVPPLQCLRSRSSLPAGHGQTAQVSWWEHRN